MKRVGFVAALAISLAACGSSSHTSTRIVLERSIGPVKLMEKKADVERALGKGSTIHDDQHHGHEVRYSDGLDVFYAPGPNGREVVFAVLTTSSRYRTRGGVGVGSSRAAVESLGGVHCYGPSQCQHGATGPRVPGTAFAFRNGKAWRIAIATDFG